MPDPNQRSYMFYINSQKHVLHLQHISEIHRAEVRKKFTNLCPLLGSVCELKYLISKIYLHARMKVSMRMFRKEKLGKILFTCGNTESTLCHGNFYSIGYVSRISFLCIFLAYFILISNRRIIPQQQTFVGEKE